eukprot:TRINITY_DN10582_c0_g1_i1.p1 TRINITY_DN10582_c0_g1~~TRINITY_DN10582_c0_g1_i1.p1  ORF type:complete len:229 (-),score=17.68 TRINITY_DN10582_c0_g1_i1:548-1234(-)
MIHTTAILGQEWNIQILELLWPAAQPYMTPDLLSAAITEILRSTGYSQLRTAPNLSRVVQFFLDKGANGLLSEASMMYATCCSSLSVGLFRQLAHANKNRLRKDDWTLLLLRAQDRWVLESSMDRLEILLDMGADPSAGLSYLFDPGWHRRLEKVLELARLLLKHGADPNEKDGKGFEVIQRFAVLCPGGRVPRNDVSLQALADLLSSNGVQIPEPSQEVCKHTQTFD